VTAELSEHEAATVARFDAAPDADEACVEKVARAICESDEDGNRRPRQPRPARIQGSSRTDRQQDQGEALMTQQTLRAVLSDIEDERARQDAKWGEQNHPDGTGMFPRADRRAADDARRECQMLAAGGMCTWRAILAEEVAEAFAETDPDKLRAELVQVATVAVQWVETLDRRAAR
jgi:hypothetical protein